MNQQREVFPLNLANYQAPIGIYIVSNIIGLVVFLLERLFPPSRTTSKLREQIFYPLGVKKFYDSQITFSQQFTLDPAFEK